MDVSNSVNEQLLSQTKQSILFDKIEFKLNENENNLNDNKALRLQYNYLKPDRSLQNGSTTTPDKHLNGLNKFNKNDGIQPPKHTIFPPNSISLEWKFSKNIGSGLTNLGNTCFMNSVLQALTYCPPLVNYLLYSNVDHIKDCRVLGLCMTCELIKHIKSSYQNSSGAIRPHNIFNRLKSLAKHFQPGRQEDSHEFLRYVIDNIWKSCIINWECSHNTKLDNQSKETTFINQIFGGYHRSQITCLNCKAKSDTYDYFMDFILDIKSVSSLEKALENFIKPEIICDENAYKCSHCNKKVSAEKRFTLHRAPNVATFQLKRFDYNRIFAAKITKQISYPEVLNLRPYMSENDGDPINYRLFAVLVHLGTSPNSGHYFCYVRNSSKGWFLMDDSRVMPKGINEVLNQQAYILFYLRTPSKAPINRSDSLLMQKDSSISSSNSVNKLGITINKPNGLMPKDKTDALTKKENSQQAVNKINQQLLQQFSNRADSPAKLNGHLSNSYYQAKAAPNQLTNLNNKWIVGESPSKCKTSSIASGSSTNSINSTTEWQVIDRDSSTSNSLKLKKSLHRNLDNSWKVADLGSHSSESDNESKGSFQQNIIRTFNASKSTNNDLNQTASKTLNCNGFKSDEDEELTYIEKRFKKKLKKLARKDEKKYKELIADQDARLKLYLKTKQKCKKRKDGLESERKNKKHKKKHKRDRFKYKSFHSSDELNDDRQNKNSNHSSNQSLTNNSANGKVISPQKNGDFNHYAQMLSKTSNGGKKNDVKNELDKMHLNLLGNNVTTWEGRKTQIDREVKEDLERSNKKSKDDLYNEEYDRGRVKKMKTKDRWEDRSAKTAGNPFQKMYENMMILKN